MLNNHQKAFIRKYIGTTQINKYSVGKDLLDKSVFDMLSKALLKHEVIKINFLKSAFVNAEKEQLILDILGTLHADLVCSIGNTIVIYKPNPKLPTSISKKIASIQ